MYTLSLCPVLLISSSDLHCPIFCKANEMDLLLIKMHKLTLYGYIVVSAKVMTYCIRVFLSIAASVYQAHGSLCILLNFNSVRQLSLPESEGENLSGKKLTSASIYAIM